MNLSLPIGLGGGRHQFFSPCFSEEVAFSVGITFPQRRHVRGGFAWLKGKMLKHISALLQNILKLIWFEVSNSIGDLFFQTGASLFCTLSTFLRNSKSHPLICTAEAYKHFRQSLEGPRKKVCNRVQFAKMIIMKDGRRGESESGGCLSQELPNFQLISRLSFSCIIHHLVKRCTNVYKSILCLIAQIDKLLVYVSGGHFDWTGNSAAHRQKHVQSKWPPDLARWRRTTNILLSDMTSDRWHYISTLLPLPPPSVLTDASSVLTWFQHRVSPLLHRHSSWLPLSCRLLVRVRGFCFLAFCILGLSDIVDGAPPSDESLSCSPFVSGSWLGGGSSYSGSSSGFASQTPRREILFRRRSRRWTWRTCPRHWDPRRPTSRSLVRRGSCPWSSSSSPPASRGFSRGRWSGLGSGLGSRRRRLLLKCCLDYNFVLHILNLSLNSKCKCFFPIYY